MEESNPLTKFHLSFFDDLFESCLPNPFPSEMGFHFIEDRLFQIENEFARSLQHFPTPNSSDQDGSDIDAILESDSFLFDAFQEESPLSLTLPGEETSSIDLLLMGAEAVETRNWEVAYKIITRLNVMFPRKENGDAPFDRLAFYFTQALDQRCLDICRMPNVAGPGTEIETGVHNTTSNICAVQMVQELSPFIKFAHFTANQAILDATLSDRDIHVVDFDIMEGIQWPPLMADLAVRDGGCSLKITAVIADHEDPCHTKSTASCTGRRLKEFAESIGLYFEFDQLVVTTEEDFQKVNNGRTVVANCMSHQVHMPYRSRAMVKTFLNGVTTLLSPKIVVLVQDELHNMTKAPANASFVDFFCEALHHYTAVSESLASGFGGGYQMWWKVVEKEILGSRIGECLRGFQWGVSGYGPGVCGYGPSPISDKNVAQAKFLVGLFSRDYRVQHGKGRRVLSLCWRSMPLLSASIWAPIQMLS